MSWEDEALHARSRRTVYLAAALVAVAAVAFVVLVAALLGSAETGKCSTGSTDSELEACP